MWRLLGICLWTVALAQNSLVSVSLNSNFNLTWTISEDKKSLTMTFICEVSDWCAIGFGNTMTNVDMIIVINQGGSVTAWDMWSTGPTKPVLDVSKGCYNNLIDISGNYSDSILTATMTRDLVTNDFCDFPIKLDHQMPFTYAYLDQGIDVFRKHDYIGTGLLTIGISQKDSNWISSGGGAYTDDYKTHGIMMGHAWMAVMLLSLVAARYFKHYWIWYWIHVAAGLYTMVITVVYGMYAYHTDKPIWSGTISQWLFHSRVGFFVVAFVPGQVILGFITRYWTWNGRSLQALSALRRAHYAMGWVLTAVSLGAVYYGLQCYHKSEMDNLEWAFTLFCLILIGFETWRWVMSFWSPRKAIPGLEKRSWADVYLGVKSGQKLAFLDTHILDISGFIDSHPGGAYLLGDTIGEDYGKYIYGVNGLEGAHAGFTHPTIVWTYVSMLKIGETGYHEGVIHMNVGPPDMHNMRWTLASKTPIAPSVARFAFVSDTLFVNPNPPGFDWMGSHFRVSFSTGLGQKVNRYYSLCLFFNQENMQKWLESAQAQGLQTSLAAGRRPSAALPTLDLIVKEYPPYGKMSTHIHKLESGDTLTITGPMGPGLIMTPTLQGHFVAFGAGTGILPFLDLVEYMWWKELYSRGEATEEQYSYLNEFTMTLYASFNKDADIIGGDLIRHTHSLCQQSKAPRFQLVLMVNEHARGNPTDIVAGVLSSRPVKRVWTCGPAGFNRWICKLAKDSGVKRDNIIVM